MKLEALWADWQKRNTTGFLVIRDALDTKRVYVCNVMTQPGKTDNFSAYDHVKTLKNHAGRRIFDYVLVNTGRPTQELLEKYRKTGSVLVEADLDRIRRAGYRAIAGNFGPHSAYAQRRTRDFFVRYLLP